MTITLGVDPILDGHLIFELVLHEICSHVKGIQMDELVEKIKELKKTVRKNPRDPNLLSNLGSYLIEAEDYDAAIEMFKKVTVLMPESADAWNNMAVAQLLANQFDQAYQTVQQARKLDLTHYQVTKTWIQLAILTGNDLEEALIELRSLGDDFPKDVDILWMHGQCLLALNETDKAKEVFSRIIAIQPDFELASMALNELD